MQRLVCNPDGILPLPLNSLSLSLSITKAPNNLTEYSNFKDMVDTVTVFPYSQFRVEPRMDFPWNIGANQQINGSILSYFTLPGPNSCLIVINRTRA